MKYAQYLLLLLCIAPAAHAGQPYRSELVDFQVEEVAAGLNRPWGMVFLPDGTMLITELGGRLKHIAHGRQITLRGVPESHNRGQGGLLSIALDPDFARNQRIYLAYTGKGEGGYSTEVVRAVLAADQLRDVQTLFVAKPRYRGGRHFGSRLLFDKAGYLYISLGDRGQREQAQAVTNHAGTLIRLHPDGRIPEDNPFVGQAGAEPAIFTYGNRNMQGLALHPQTGAIWTHEHGPQGGDELNLMQAGGNYGWPIITYGVNYGFGTKIGEGTHKAGMLQPRHVWTPSIAPSGMAFYTGDQLPAWQGNVFVGSLKFGQVARLALAGDQVTGEERLFDGEYGRIRDIVNGPDGLLYFLTDERDGRLYRIAPL